MILQQKPPYCRCEMNVRFGNENLWMDIETYESEEIVAVRHEKRQEGGVIWDSDFVMNFRERKMANITN